MYVKEAPLYTCNWPVNLRTCVTALIEGWWYATFDQGGIKKNARDIDIERT